MPGKLDQSQVIKQPARLCRESYSVLKEMTHFDSQVLGIITLTDNLFFFEPDINDPYVLKDGILPYQVYLPISDIFDVQVNFQ